MKKLAAMTAVAVAALVGAGCIPCSTSTEPTTTTEPDVTCQAIGCTP